MGTQRSAFTWYVPLRDWTIWHSWPQFITLDVSLFGLIIFLSVCLFNRNDSFHGPTFQQCCIQIFWCQSVIDFVSHLQRWSKWFLDWVCPHEVLVVSIAKSVFLRRQFPLGCVVKVYQGDSDVARSAIVGAHMSTIVIFEIYFSQFLPLWPGNWPGYW